MARGGAGVLQNEGKVLTPRWSSVTFFKGLDSSLRRAKTTESVGVCMWERSWNTHVSEGREEERRERRERKREEKGRERKRKEEREREKREEKIEHFYLLLCNRA